MFASIYHRLNCGSNCSHRQISAANAGGKNIGAGRSPTYGKRARRNLRTLTMMYRSVGSTFWGPLGVAAHKSVLITQNFHFFVDKFDFGLIYFTCSTSEILCDVQYISVV